MTLLRIHVEDAADQALVAKYQESGQHHIFDDWEDLDSSQRRGLLDALQKIDLGFIQQLIRDHMVSDPDHPPIATPTPPPLISLEDPKRELAREKGLEAIRNGELAIMLLAGGVGTRLGHPGPKGSYPLLPVSQGTLFQLFAESLWKLQKEMGTTIPWWIMTSPSNHQETVQYFRDNNYHGLNSSDVIIEPQEELPVIDARRGRILRSGPGKILFSPDGHGGAIRLLQRNANWFRSRGIKHVYTHQVDNPLAILGDPEFLGLHLLDNSVFSSKAVAKTNPEEKVGVFCQTGEHLRVIEYSELGEEERHRRNDEGELSFRAGNVAMHMIDLEFILGDESGEIPALPMPFHMANKSVRHWYGGEWHESDSPNSVRFETFIFDVLSQAPHALVVEASRDLEFAPVKNSSGNDSPESSRAALQKLWAQWLIEAGIELDMDDQGQPKRTLEISPRLACNVAQLKKVLDQITIPDEGPILIR
ncbi:UTP--glucose-1-phosphate uridylyltransferase [Planctomycetota bacterium]|nr:UTP--glucose-1-phosphate uridylyltransferase [Planctomycetota bacterium]MDC0346981.1 UTP--glucose-1-phosphate uridylyltransferase [Planctomycetota bacterium]